MAEVEEFVKCVEDGLNLSKRIYFGNDRSVAPPKPMLSMEKSAQSLLPPSPMVYAVIPDPAVVDNPDVPSYQPHVHGRCDPPALIPLQMNKIALEADCYLDTAFLTITGSWRVHCVKGNRSCDCRIAIPMGEQRTLGKNKPTQLIIEQVLQGSILGVEVEITRKSYSTQLVAMDDKIAMEKVAKIEDGGFLKPHIFTITVPKVDGGSNLSIKVRWLQRISYKDEGFSFIVPFSFPEYVVPAGKKMSKKEKIHVTINSEPLTEVVLKAPSHPLKELKPQAGMIGFLYESEVLTWSNSDLVFTYGFASHTSGGFILQSPPVLDIDRRDMFCFYLFPGKHQSKKVIRKEVVFLVDISGSMKGQPLEDTKNALFKSLSYFNPEDSFTVIAFNDDTFLFSSSPQVATKEAIENATQWISTNFIAGGGTNILSPLNQALEMLSSSQSSVPIVFLVTDGTVEDERHICDVLKSHQTTQGSIAPRLYTFGIGTFCNHYFLRMLATIGRGHHDAAYDTDSIEAGIEGLFARASSTVVANIAFDGLDGVDELELYPSRIPDLTYGGPLIVSGRFQGDFPKNAKATGILAGDTGTFLIDLKVQEANGIPLDKVLAKQQIELLTAQAWFAEDKELEEKIAKISIQTSVISEYTRMIMHEAHKIIEVRNPKQSPNRKQSPDKAEQPTLIVLQSLGLGFGNLIATKENIRPGCEEAKSADGAEMIARAASNCCGKMCSYCCGMCCIKACSRINDQCAIALTQLCGALSCLACSNCCESCCTGQEG